jgi:NAD(P)-dependent dehydrogenase (short-subunit alcohol dehydrogenase family)
MKGMKPVSEQVVLITGATDGLGKAVAADLAAAGATVLLHGRSEERGEQAMREIRELTGRDRLRFYWADLASLDQVRALADAVLEAEPRLDALVNNAGIGTRMPGGGRPESEDGYELRFAVNYLSHYLLTRRLLPLITQSAPARIVNVSSGGQWPIDFDDVMLQRGYDGTRAYAQSKLAQIMFTVELAERLRDAGETEVTVNALHPATFMDTKMVRTSFGRAGRSEVAEGVESLVHLVADPELDGVSGRYFDQLEEGTAHPQAYDAEARRRLWALSEELVGQPFEV